MHREPLRHEALLHREPDELVPGVRASLPLPPPAAEVHAIEFDHDLVRLRRFVRAHAAAARLPEARICDLLVAANEAATSTLLLTGAPGVVRVWCEADAFVCELLDQGRIDDPPAGRRLPHPTYEHGRSLWLVHELCDLVELRSGEHGTALRLHMRLGDDAAAPVEGRQVGRRGARR